MSILGPSGNKMFDEMTAQKPKYVINAVPKFGGKTIADGGVPPGGAGGSGEAQAQAAWDEAMKLLKREGPYTPQVTQQLVNRQADQTAFAEGVNAEELRNSAAARGLSPNDPGIQAALRQAQAQRQQSNVAFQGDIGSQAAIQNFAATQPGYMAAAQANLNRQFGGQRTPAVQGGPRMSVAPTATRQPTAFSGPAPAPAPAPAPKPVVSPAPQKKPMSVADRNAAQAAWVASGGKTINGTTPGGTSPTAAANSPYQPATYGNTAFGPVSTAQNARSYQNIYKYTN